MSCSRLVALSCVLIGMPFALIAAEPSRPNVLLILVDDLGYGDLSSYGAPDLRTPAIDQLVAAGMRLDNFYANCPVCSPTRAALMTGRYPELVGVPGVIRTYAKDNWGYLAADATTLPEVLREAGYQTAMVGKWHLGLDTPSHPNQRGFQFFHGFLGDMMDDYYHHRRHDRNYMRKNETQIDPPGHATDLFSQWACDYLHDKRKETEPFFLYLAYNAPHTPIQPPDDWIERVKKREPNIDPQRAKLVALIEHLDAGIGRVTSMLKETGLTDNTLVIFTSDNGGQISVGANNGPLRDGKGTMYEGGLKVPACAVWPGKITPGSTSSRIGLTMDLFPTICAAAGTRAPQSIEGRSILPTLFGQPQPAESRDLFFVRREGGDRYGGLTVRALRRGDWKLLQNSPYGPLELFHLGRDPREANDVYQSQRKVFREMAAALRLQVQRGGAVPWQRPDRRDVK